ncbi:hypothetical protein F503_02262 [Ophiostoma piceae UAMH 11346]|uniref:non-specific serine/threonine protein kinase n=1 Tax=Ophiostoma piceae (strain UAMH 11346) TaxID=1262450 RepID=S3CGT8_OPHP1|nr:hypothetical protein F503_02262 [Ophiostoma piceae UAMH 11346]
MEKEERELRYKIKEGTSVSLHLFPLFSVLHHHGLPLTTTSLRKPHRITVCSTLDPESLFRPRLPSYDHQSHLHQRLFNDKMPRRRGRQPKLKFKMPFLDRGLSGAPYLQDTKWTIQEHDPLPPFGEGYKTMHRRGPAAFEQMWQEQIPQSIYCMHNQPPGPEPPADALKLDILVVEELRNPLVQGSQVVGCKIINRSRTKNTSHASDSSAGRPQAAAKDIVADIGDDTVIVAKIFDPMYYYHNGTFDIVDLADMEYCREAAAYTHLQRQGVGGQWLPKYLGSYTLEIPLSEEQKEYLAEIKGADHPLLQSAVPVRRVRLILTEKITGESMTYQLVFGDVKGLSDETRLDAVASTLEAYAHLFFHGIVHGDLAPRNVFVLDESELEYSDGDSGVVSVKQRMASNHRRRRPRFYRFVDLGLAYILGEECSAHARQDPGETRPRNPIQLFWNVFDSGAVNMYYWLPQHMRSTPVFQRWLLRRWYGDTRFEAVGAVPVLDPDDKLWGAGDEDGNTEDVVAPAVAVHEEDERKQRKLEEQQERRYAKQGSRRCHNVVARAIAILPVIKTTRSISNSRQVQYTAASATTVENASSDKPQGFW